MGIIKRGGGCDLKILFIFKGSEILVSPISSVIISVSRVKRIL